MLCERCGAGPAGAELFDSCALCGTRLCDDCMASGCCGQVPAISARDTKDEWGDDWEAAEGVAAEDYEGQDGEEKEPGKT